AIPAIIIALPLYAFGFLLLGWLNADDAVKRRAAEDSARAEAQLLEAAALAALDAKSRAVFERIEAVRQEGDPDGQLRRMVYTGEITFILIRRGAQLVFPLSDAWGLGIVEDERRHQLSVAADLHSGSD